LRGPGNAFIDTNLSTSHDSSDAIITITTRANIRAQNKPGRERPQNDLYETRPAIRTYTVRYIINLVVRKREPRYNLCPQMYLFHFHTDLMHFIHEFTQGSTRLALALLRGKAEAVQCKCDRQLIAVGAGARSRDRILNGCI